MRRFFLFAVAVLLALALWSGLVIAGALEGWWRTPLAPRGNTGAFLEAATAFIDTQHRGNAAFALVENGLVVGEHFVSIGEPVDGDTRFQVASLSKWIAAWGVMTLVEAGKLELDRPVAAYLTRWNLPPSDFDAGGVTVRRLLSHTAGLTDGLGYAGFAPGTPPQHLEDSLTQAADASPGRDGAVRVGLAPGSAFAYSGGGYTLLQLLIEEVSGQTFDDYMRAHVFVPLGMTRSTFILEEGAEEGAGAKLAMSYDSNGAPATLYRFTALAAASLYTTTNDLARFLAAHVEGVNGEPTGRGVLHPETLAEMRRPHAAQFGVDIWGLGLILYAPNNAGSYIIGHDGDNEPEINTTARLDPESGDGIVVLESGAPLLATRLGGEWVFWKTGHVDFLMVMMEAQSILTILAAGWFAIAALALVVAWRSRRRQHVAEGALRSS